jgi:hypothetical protein
MDAGTTGAAGASAPHAFCIHNFLGAVRVQVMGAQKISNEYLINNERFSFLFFTLLGFLCSYRGIYSIFPSNQFPFNNPL